MNIATSRKRGGTPHPTAAQQAIEQHTEINGPEALHEVPETRPLDKDDTGSKPTTAGTQPLAGLQPIIIFLLLSALFWSCWLVTYSGYQKQLTLDSIPCNPKGRPLGVCAHRANAAELLGSNKTNSGISTPLNLGYPLIQQMTELWKVRVRCFDLDVVQLSGGELIVGHPADLVQHARAVGSSSSNNKAGNLVAGFIHEHTLSKLRAAGIGEAAAPLLQTVLHHFAQLVGDEHEQQSTAATAAVGRDNWQHTPVLSIELKGPAASSLEAWKQVIRLANAAGVSAYVLLMVRQPSSSSRGRPALLQLAAGMKEASAKAAGSRKDNRLATAAGPLLGLIVPDALLQQQLLRQQKPDKIINSTAATHVLLLQAAGAGVSLATTGAGHQATAAAAGAAGNITAAAVLEMFDVLAPSIKLLPSILTELVGMKPVMAWTLESDEDEHRAMWLGLDLCSSNRPVAHRQQTEAIRNWMKDFCSSKHRPK